MPPCSKCAKTSTTIFCTGCRRVAANEYESALKTGKKRSPCYNCGTESMMATLKINGGFCTSCYTYGHPKTSKIENPDKAEKSEKKDNPEKPEKSEKKDKAEKSEKKDKPEKQTTKKGRPKQTDSDNDDSSDKKA